MNSAGETLEKRLVQRVRMKKTSAKVPDLQAHCAALSRICSERHFYEEGDFVREGERYNYQNAADWLELGAGICGVQVLTARFDDTLMYCGTAMDYEGARSELLSRIVTQLTIFQFAWGAFETIAKIADPPSIPVNDRFQGKNGLVDRVIYYLKDVKPIKGYAETLAQLKGRLSAKNPFPGFGEESILCARSGTRLRTARPGSQYQQILRTAGPEKNPRCLISSR